MRLVFSTNRFITWGMSHVMNLLMEGPRLTIPPKFMNRFITWEMPHVMNLFMGRARPYRPPPIS